LEVEVLMPERSVIDFSHPFIVYDHRDGDGAVKIAGFTPYVDMSVGPSEDAQRNTSLYLPVDMSGGRPLPIVDDAKWLPF
jgi:hypothetical protein